MHVKVPREALRYTDDHDLPVIDIGSVLLPPSAVPAGHRPAVATLTLVSDSSPETVRAVLDGIGGVDPTTEVGTPGVVVTSLQQITVVKSLLGIGMVLGLVIGVAAYLVAATDRAVRMGWVLPTDAVDQMRRVCTVRSRYVGEQARCAAYEPPRYDSAPR